jgi:PAS domain S-box-containing protein
VTSRNAAGTRVDESLIQESTDDLYEHAPSGYLSVLPDGTIVRINQTLLDWLGYTRDALVARVTFQSLLSIGSRMYYETHYAPLLRMQGFVKEIALDLRGADGRTLPVLVNARERRDEAGAAVLTRMIVFDASDRRRYERELLLARRKAEQVAKDKADLIAMLSHDIRNPLNAVMGAVQILERSDLTDAQRRFVHILKSSSGHMLTLLNHVLELSRAESSSFALVEAPFSLRAVVDDLVTTYEAKARDKQLELRAAVDEQVPAELVGDPIAMRQILTNLVGNAIKFTDRGSVSVTVTTRDRAADAVTIDVAVADTGIGIAPEEIARIFNAFTQASYETAVKFGGTGLGLAIARKLLGLYGSTITVASTPGEGSTFSFSLRLPVARARETSS